MPIWIMWRAGVPIGDEYYFLIRTPLESIRESVSISNSFYLYVGITIILVSGLAIWIITKRITKPISELTLLSRKMSDLDFDAKYESHAGNEIDVLGENFNRMSEQLEKTISELKSANNELQKDIESKIRIDQMRREFLNNVSHELKTPIAWFRDMRKDSRKIFPTIRKAGNFTVT